MGGGGSQHAAAVEKILADSEYIINILPHISQAPFMPPLLLGPSMLGFGGFCGIIREIHPHQNCQDQLSTVYNYQEIFSYQYLQDCRSEGFLNNYWRAGGLLPTHKIKLCAKIEHLIRSNHFILHEIYRILAVNSNYHRLVNYLTQDKFICSKAAKNDTLTYTFLFITHLYHL